MWKPQPCRHQAQWRRRGKSCSRSWRRNSPAAHDADHGDVGSSPTSHVDHDGAYFHTPLWRTLCQSRWMCPEGSCSLWRTRILVGSWQELQPMERSPFRTRFSGRIYDPVGFLHKFHLHWSRKGSMKDTHAGAGCEELTLEQFLKDSISGRDPTLEQGNVMRRKVQQRWDIMNWTQLPPFPILLHC